MQCTLEQKQQIAAGEMYSFYQTYYTNIICIFALHSNNLICLILQICWITKAQIEQELFFTGLIKVDSGGPADT